MAFRFEQGRYYLAMWYLDASPKLHPPHGGNLTVMASRKLDEPNEWFIQYRHRYYCKEELGKVLFEGSKDRFKWYEMHAHNEPEDLVAAKISLWLSTVEVFTGGESRALTPFWIHGDIEKIMELVRAGQVPEWMNVRLVEMPAKKPHGGQ